MRRAPIAMLVLAVLTGRPGATGAAPVASPVAAPAQQPALTEAYVRIATWQSNDVPPTPGLFLAPWGVAVGADGTIYVADGGLHAVHVLAADGTPRSLWREGAGGAPDLGEVRDVALGNGVVFISEPDGDRIHRFDPDGTYRGAWAVNGSPAGLAFGGGELYATTIEGREVVVLDATGAVVRYWDPDSSPLQLPWGIDVGADGRVYVADIGGTQQRVWIFDADGVLVGALAAVLDGVEVPIFDVAVDANLDVFLVTELKLLRQRLGVDIGLPTDNPGGRGVAAGPGSGLVVTAQDERLGFTGVRHFRDRRADQMTPELWGNPFAPLGSLDEPRRVSANTDDRVFVVDSWPRVQAWHANGTPRVQFGTLALHDVAAGLRGSVFSITGAMLTYWTEDGINLWNWQPPSLDPQGGNDYGWLTSLDSLGGEIAVMDTGDQRVHLLDFSGNPLGEWPIAPPDGFESVSDLALGTSAVYVVNRSRKVVEVRARADGRVLDTWQVPGVAERIDVGPDGNVYILTREGWVWKRAPDGREIALWQASTDHRSAADLAAGVGGQVFVAFGAPTDPPVAVFAPDPGATPPEVPVFADRCDLVHDKTAAPAALQLGDSVEISLTVDGDCPLADAQSDVLLLVDTSGSMSGTKMGAARSAALEFVGQLDYGLSQVGLISFSTEVELVQPLTANPRELIRAIPDLGDDAGTNMLAAFGLAAEEFASPRARPGARKVIVLLTDGRPNSGAGALLQMAQEYRDNNNEIYAIGLGLDVDRAFLRGMATQPSYYFEAPSGHDLSKIYATIARRVAASVLLAQATVTDELPANMRFLPNTDSPRTTYSPSGRTLTWTLSAVPSRGLRLRYRVQPLETGTWPTNVRAAADYVDGVYHAGTLTFPVPVVDVSRPERWSVFLPIAQKRKCPEARVDVALVIDTSASMRESTGPGLPTKLEAAVHAGRVFVSQLRLPADQVAIVAFNGAATVVQPLSGDQLALVEALGRLPVGSGTRIDLGLETAREALAGRRPGTIPAVVLLTDGRQSGEPELVAEAVAARARAEGLVLFAVGLGADVDRDLLGRLTADPQRTYFAPGEDELAEVYRLIASAIPCQ